MKIIIEKKTDEIKLEDMKKLFRGIIENEVIIIPKERDYDITIISDTGDVKTL